MSSIILPAPVRTCNDRRLSVQYFQNPQPAVGQALVRSGGEAIPSPPLRELRGLEDPGQREVERPEYPPWRHARAPRVALSCNDERAPKGEERGSRGPTRLGIASSVFSRGRYVLHSLVSSCMVCGNCLSLGPSNKGRPPAPNGTPFRQHMTSITTTTTITTTARRQYLAMATISDADGLRSSSCRQKHDSFAVYR